MAPSKHTQLVCICAGSSEVSARCDAIGGIIWLKDCLQALAEAVPDSYTVGGFMKSIS